MLRLAIRTGIAAFAVIVAGAAAPAPNVEPDMTPAIFPGERYFPIGQDCGYLALAGEEADEKSDTPPPYLDHKWTGPCEAGLAHGRGQIIAPDLKKTIADITFTYGRLPTHSAGTTKYGSYEGFSTGGRYVHLTRTDSAQYAPFWADPHADSELPSTVSVTEHDGKWNPSRSVSTTRTNCFIDAQKFPGCELDEDFEVFGVQTTDTINNVVDTKTFWCPDPKTPQGCEGLWREKLAAIMPQVQEIIAASRAYDERVQQEGPAKFAAWKIYFAAKQAYDKKVGAAAAARVLADIRKEEAAFRAKLKTGNAGELFALADHMGEEEDWPRAREALRALLERFPNSPLAPTAARLLAGGKP